MPDVTARYSVFNDFKMLHGMGIGTLSVNELIQQCSEPLKATGENRDKKIAMPQELGLNKGLSFSLLISELVSFGYGEPNLPCPDCIASHL